MSKIRIRVPRPWAGYPGSALQNSYAEALEHGYLLWDIDHRNSFDVKFCDLPNPKPYVTIDWAGTVDRTLALALCHSPGCRVRIRSKEVLTQQDVTNLTHELHRQLKVVEVTFKDDHVINRDVITAGSTVLAKDDLRNPEVLLQLVQGYHSSAVVSDDEWLAMSAGIKEYLGGLGADDVVRNTKWSLKHLAFDNTFAYGTGNVINFEQLPGIVGIFGPNRMGKSSVIGTIMYSLFNATDRGSIKNLHVVNVRHPYCLTRALLGVNGVNYVIERQTTKTTPKNGPVYASTHLNVFRIDDGEAIDLGGEERRDTEKVIRHLIGTTDDCLLTSIAVQDDVKAFINQGSPARRKTLSRFLDLDIFDRMYDLAKDDVNVSKSQLRSLPDRDWAVVEQQLRNQLAVAFDAIRDKGHQLLDVGLKLDAERRQLAGFRDFVPVTLGQVEGQRARVKSLTQQLVGIDGQIGVTQRTIAQHLDKLVGLDRVLEDYDVADMRQRLDAYKSLEASFEALRLAFDADDTKLKGQERALKILADVPCGDQFPTCKFIKDAHKNKDRIEVQRERTHRAQDRLRSAEVALIELRQQDLVGRVNKVEQLIDRRNKLQLTLSAKRLELQRLETQRDDVGNTLEPVERRLAELVEALKNEENVEVVALRNSIDVLSVQVKTLDVEKLTLASTVGRLQSDLDKLVADLQQRQRVLQQMKVHELIAQAFSRRGIPKLIVMSQLPVINAEIAQILLGIVDFNIELEVDDDSDSMEVYINYGDSRRPIELCSGMEKMIASVAIRVALVNVSSLPKSDMLILDECFGSLDDAQVEACNRLLVSLKRYFRSVVVISHVEGIKDVADHIIEITRIEKDSRVNYGSP